MTAAATAARAVRRAALLVALAAWSREARAQFSVSGSPATLNVSTATAGLGLNAVTDASTTYTYIKSSGGHHEITAQINAPMPAGVTLTVQLAAPGGGATSSGPVTLGIAALPVVTGIAKSSASSTITYQLSATPAAGIVPAQSRTVTFTIVATP